MTYARSKDSNKPVQPRSLSSVFAKMIARDFYKWKTKNPIRLRGYTVWSESSLENNINTFSHIAAQGPSESFRKHAYSNI